MISVIGPVGMMGAVERFMIFCKMKRMKWSALAMQTNECDMVVEQGECDYCIKRRVGN